MPSRKRTESDESSQAKPETYDSFLGGGAGVASSPSVGEALPSRCGTSESLFRRLATHCGAGNDQTPIGAMKRETL